ncbi:MAG TPA: hypothetical protein VL285_07930 [Bryobacteraceae bacterium]|nr:hypothetical protein [Bryobacteraceae bacterium]
MFPIRLAAAALWAFSLTPAPGQTGRSADEYHIYAGSTHAHTASTWSHGDQWAKNGCAGILVYSRGPGAAVHTWSSGYVKSQNGCSGIFVIDGAQYPSPDVKLKPDWREGQGPPSEHYSLAKAKGYDFYVTSDHSQEAAFQPPAEANAEWAAAKQQAAAASSAEFAALAGFEFSENDGPGGTGHFNVINSAGMLNALAPGWICLSFIGGWPRPGRTARVPWWRPSIIPAPGSTPTGRIAIRGSPT